MKTNPSIAELARQCSESWHLLFERLGADLDCKMGAFLGSRKARRQYPPSPQQQSATHVDDEDKPLDPSSSGESPVEPVSFPRP
ncbi:MAG: hypothetical protein WBE44_01695 [Terriglobales bacterium]